MAIGSTIGANVCAWLGRLPAGAVVLGWGVLSAFCAVCVLCAVLLYALRLVCVRGRQVRTQLFFLRRHYH